MYVYVHRSTGLCEVPEALLNQLGDVELVMTLPLTAERKLARADAEQVLAEVNRRGYYLQMPPTTFEPVRRDKADE